MITPTLIPISIELSPLATMLTFTDCGVVVRPLGTNTQAYWFEQVAAEELSCLGVTRVEIKDIAGTIYRYDHAVLARLGWLT